MSQLRSLSRRRLIAFGSIIAGALIAVLLIILWQVGLFDSAPPPATIESAVQSVRQETEQEAQAASAQADEEQAEPEDQDAPEQVEQEQGESAAQSQGYAASYAVDQTEQQSVQSPSAEPQEAEADQDATQQAAQQQSQTAQETMTAEPPSLADLAGVWTLSQQGTSFVGYRIGEELANIGTATAVGRTSAIVATLEFDGEAITSVTIEADLRTLKSDQSFRDSALRDRGIETDTYPFTTFVLSEPISIGNLPTGEETLSVTVQGTLDLHGVTNPVSIALEGQYVDGLVVVVGSTEIALVDYDIEKPTGFRVLSIDDVGIMEFQLVLERAP